MAISSYMADSDYIGLCLDEKHTLFKLVDRLSQFICKKKNDLGITEYELST